MWCGAGSTTSLTSAFLMGEAGTEALTKRGAVRPGDHTQCPGQPSDDSHCPRTQVRTGIG